MARFIFGLLIIATSFTGCTKRATSGTPLNPLQGVWARDGDSPGMDPADTLTFAVRNGKNVLSFYLGGSPGPNWPSQVETEYRFENGKFNYRNYFHTDNDFFEVESFQWETPEKTFSVKLYEVVRYMSADYRVTYRKLN